MTTNTEGLKPYDLLHDDGENQAVRMFLALYSGADAVTTQRMRKHLQMAGYDNLWPEWANEDQHLTKDGAQAWIRYLFDLEHRLTAQASEATIKVKDSFTFNSIRNAALEEAADYICGITDRAADSASLDNREMHQDEKAVMHALCDAAENIRGLSTMPVELVANPDDAIRPIVQDAPSAIAGWLPIESAPKDGNNYLFYRKGLVNTARWLGGTWGGSGWSYELAENIANGFTENLPTHWMPLPAAPTQSMKDE